jgi:hypothetical protein
MTAAKLSLALDSRDRIRLPTMAGIRRSRSLPTAAVGQSCDRAEELLPGASSSTPVRPDRSHDPCRLGVCGPAESWSTLPAIQVTVMFDFKSRLRSAMAGSLLLLCVSAVAAAKGGED